MFTACLLPPAAKNPPQFYAGFTSLSQLWVTVRINLGQVDSLWQSWQKCIAFGLWEEIRALKWNLFRKPQIRHFLLPHIVKGMTQAEKQTSWYWASFDSASSFQRGLQQWGRELKEYLSDSPMHYVFPLFTSTYCAVRCSTLQHNCKLLLVTLSLPPKGPKKVIN